ncbi:hypothetical protein [Skermanella stibiiresistens]|uniref:hypothetical protein n=1 Tax=Skermanella stibiiresistens TaxID=913326 RepID=UPI0004B0E71E|nr:hypothetical protein [Skermanella stibiiresistens]
MAQAQCHPDSADEIEQVRRDLSAALGGRRPEDLMRTVVTDYDGEAPFHVMGDAAAQVLKARGWAKLAFEGGDVTLVATEEGRRSILG